MHQKALRMTLVIALVVLFSAAAKQVTYELASHERNGVEVVDDKGKLVLLPDRRYEYCCDELGAEVGGTFDYDEREREFTFDGELSSWGVGAMSGDERRDIGFAFKDGQGHHRLTFARRKGFTICPIWPLC